MLGDIFVILLYIAHIYLSQNVVEKFIGEHYLERKVIFEGKLCEKYIKIK